MAIRQANNAGRVENVSMRFGQDLGNRIAKLIARGIRDKLNNGFPQAGHLLDNHEKGI